MHSLKNVWQKFVYSISLLSMFAMLLGPVTIGRADFGFGFTPAACDNADACSK